MRARSLTVLFAPALLLLALAWLATPTPATAGPKVQVCHIPPGNPSNFHTITISEKAYSAHLAHGDLGGACSAQCATLCDDGDACTIDDTGDCESAGCPTLPDPADCNDQNECTADSCDSAIGCVNTARIGKACDDGQLCSGLDTCDDQGICQGPAIDNCCLGDADCSQNLCDQASCNLSTNRCSEDPKVCESSDLCSVSECAPDTTECVESPVVCDEGQMCNPDTGNCTLEMTFGADRDNTLLGGNHANTNFGVGCHFLIVGGFAGGDERAIIGFDVSALSGQFSSIEAITLRLTAGADAAADNTLTNQVFAISAENRDWTEGHAHSCGGGANGTTVGDSTWNERHLGTSPGLNGTPWEGSAGLSTAVADYDDTLLASNAFTAIPDNLPNLGDVIDFTFTGSSTELTNLINAWLDDNVTNSQPNPGLILLDPAGPSADHNERVGFLSREVSDADQRPHLIVTYTP
jgi:hypothetical protein